MHLADVRQSAEGVAIDCEDAAEICPVTAVGRFT